jgi:hypothetical protein
MAQGVRLDGLNAKGIANRQDALERAEQLRPVFAEMAGMFHRGIAGKLNARGLQCRQAANGTPSR